MCSLAANERQGGREWGALNAVGIQDLGVLGQCRLRVILEGCGGDVSL